MTNAGKKARMKNGDAIRQMSDEELAEFVCGGCMHHKEPLCVQNCLMLAKGGDETTCKQCWLNWLKQEVESDA